MMEKIATATSLGRSKLDRQQSTRAEFKQHSAEHSGAHKQQVDGPDRALVNLIGFMTKRIL